MRRPVAYEGHRHTICYAVCQNGKSPGEAFYDALGDSDKAKINKLFEYLGDHGEIRNEEKFKKIGNNLFEFKSHQIRMLCFHSSAGYIVTHGFYEKRAKTPPAEIARAERIKDEDATNERHDES